MKEELIVNLKPKSSVSEAIKTIRTNLQFASIDGQVHSILITSSVPAEGKSFVVANLAIAFAQTGSNVLIVDCDLRRGRQHEIFNVSNKIGLSNLVMEDIKNYKKYIKKSKIENLSVLPRGIVPPNPSEILASKKNKELMETLEKNYDIILYDGAPVAGLADSVIMADLVDKIVIVSAYKQTKMEELLSTKKQLEKFESKIVGVIVNKMAGKKNHYYYNYYK